MPYIRNSTPFNIWVADMYWAPDACGEYGNFRTEGWWLFKPQERYKVGPSDGRALYWYAETEDGTRHWTGPYGPVYVTDEAFESCLGIGSTAAYKVTMRKHDPAAYPGGVTLV
ncbi:hypothetical protein [Streptomyces sp. NPDC019890]|uniref:hypothetical protein n=1 Tax=Streptomyces sp. NPDC019890 TaxID=3365064 RepID=UPI00384B41F8